MAGRIAPVTSGAFSGPAVCAAPFPHFFVKDALDHRCEVLLDWLETAAPWQLKTAAFYQQYEFNVLDATLPCEVGSLFAATEVDSMKECVSRAFSSALGPRREITVHKLIAGQRIRIHNDYIAGQETHRVLIQLNRGWHDQSGGELLFFSSEDSRDLEKMIRPVHNTCVAFEISPKSYHAVAPVACGERYTLVYSFYRSEG